MGRGTIIQTNMTAGEISPLALGLVDQSRYHNSGATVENWLIRSLGPLSKRPGLQFIAAAKYHDKRCRLIRFEFNVEQAYCLECGHEYIRYFKDRGQIDDGGLPYEIVSPYQEQELRGIKFIQSADAMYLVHPSYWPRQLTRSDHTAWALNELDLEDGPYLEENTTGITIQPSGTTGAITLTAVPVVGGEMVVNGDFATSGTWIWGTGWSHDAVNLEADHTPGNTAALEQNVSVIAAKTYLVTFTIKNRTAGSVVPTLGGVNGNTRGADGVYSETITASTTGNLKFTPSTDFDGSIDDVSVKETSGITDIFQPGHVGAYWRLKHGTWGYVRITEVTDNLHAEAEVKKTLGGTGAVTTWREGAFSDYRGHPSAVAFYEERFILGGTAHKPWTYWGSRSHEWTDFAPEDTVTDDGPITFTVPSQTGSVNVIRWICGSRTLLVGTAGEEVTITGSGTGDPLSPSNPPVIRASTAKGSADMMPVALGNAILFMQRHGLILRELAYSYMNDDYLCPNLTIWNEHITRGGIVEMDFQREPDQVLWTVRQDGQMPTMIYEPDQKVVGWGRLVTDGEIESVAVIPGTKQSEIWAAVKRTINGETKRYIESFKDIDWGDDRQDAFFVDSGLTYDGLPTMVISGLGHLEGKEVAVWASGAEHPRRTVVGGQISLNYAASKAQVGLPIISTFKSVPLEAGQEEGTAQGKPKVVDKVVLRLVQSIGGQVGPDLDSLEPIHYRQMADLLDTAVPLFDDDVEIDYRGWTDSRGQLTIVHDSPGPMTICAIIPRLTTYEG